VFCQHLLRLIKSAVLADTDISVKPKYWPDISAWPIYQSVFTQQWWLQQKITYIPTCSKTWSVRLYVGVRWFCSLVPLFNLYVHLLPWCLRRVPQHCDCLDLPSLWLRTEIKNIHKIKHNQEALPLNIYATDVHTILNIIKHCADMHMVSFFRIHLSKAVVVF